MDEHGTDLIDEVIVDGMVAKSVDNLLTFVSISLMRSVLMTILSSFSSKLASNIAILALDSDDVVDVRACVDWIAVVRWTFESRLSASSK